MKKQPKRKRAPGGGRKPLPPGQRRRTKNYRLAPEVADYLESVSATEGQTASGLLESLIRESEEFRQWSLGNGAKPNF